MYTLIAIASIFIRFKYIPNPFESLQCGYMINLIFEPISHLFTYFLVGLYYTKGSFPVLGSFFYLFFYAINIGLIILISIFNWNIFAIIIISLTYLAIHIFAKISFEGGF